MPRTGWVKPESDRRLSDLVSVGLLTRVFPPDVVDAVIAEAGRTEVRQRALPARVMAYFSIGMALSLGGFLCGCFCPAHRWSVVDDGMGTVVVGSVEIGYLSGSFTIGV